MNEEDSDIAVVGIGCNFPGGEGLDHFWKVLLEGKNCTSPIPQDRFDSTQWCDGDDSKLGKSRTDKAALAEGFNELDHRFFGLTEAEVEQMDPQHKLLLQCTYRALEDAGLPMEKASGSKTGVFLGLMNRDYELTMASVNPVIINHCTGTGLAMSIAANRISYIFNLTGPSLTIDCACSSSLVALHLACQAIRQGDCEMAVCGGVNCIFQPRVFVALSKAKMISPDGASKAFSSDADGYGRGEGCGIVLIKPLKTALQDHDHIWGIICKTAVNQDGHTVTPMTKPSVRQQEELLNTIYSTGSFLQDVQYVEAHGTGTPVGDPIEAASISKIIAKARPAELGPLCVGSVKSNIGHTESAAGVAGLIKVLLMIKHRTIVPSLFYSEQSSSIDAPALNLTIPTRPQEWGCSSAAGRVAGVNSFGFGGTNAHAIVREYTCARPCRVNTTTPRKFLPLSAASSKSLEMCIADIRRRISTDHKADLNSLLYTSACRRSHIKHKYRKVFLASSLSDLEEQLKSGHNKTFTTVKAEPRLVFVFCGNGVTFRGMCRQLVKEEPVFREKLLEVENYFKKYRDVNILQKIVNSFDSDDFSKPDIMQPLLFAVQVAVVSLLKHWGIRPTAVLGHSIGEVAAAHCSGLLSLEDAVKVIYWRSTFQSEVTGGRMLVVSNVPVSDVQNILAAYTGKICLAAFNSPLSCVLSGDKEAVESVHEMAKTLFKGKNVFLHILNVPAAYHSHMMDPVLSQIKDKIGVLNQHEMECELFSTVTSKTCCEGDFVTGDYWARNVRNPVVFEQTLKAVGDSKNVIFVEISPRRVLQRNIVETLGNSTVVFSSVLPERDHEAVMAVVSRLFELGVNVDWNKFYEGFESPPTSYPVYQFDSCKNEVYFEEIRQGNETVTRQHHPLIRPDKRNGTIVTCHLSSDAMPYIWEHRSSGVVVAPGALYVELAFASVLETVVPKRLLSSLILTINFQNLLVLHKSSCPLKVQLESSENKTLFQISSPAAVHASGTVTYGKAPVLPEHKAVDLDAILNRCSAVITEELIYTTLRHAGFEYGPVLRQLRDIHYGEELGEAMATVSIPDELLNHLHEYCLHPVVLDYFLQMTCVLVLSSNVVQRGFPSAVGSVVISAPLCNEVVIYMRVTLETSQYIEVCGSFSDKNGHTLVELKHVRITFLEDSVRPTNSYFFHNETRTVLANSCPYSKPKAVIFEDSLGMAGALKPYLHPSSVFFTLTGASPCTSQVADLLQKCDQSKPAMEKVLLIWGFQNLSHLKTQTVVRHLVDVCELYRRVIVTLRKCAHLRAVHVITYRSSESTVDRISPGFVLSGLTRACAAELPEISFQLIDLATVSSLDIAALVKTICSSEWQEYPEVMISEGQVQSVVVTRAPVNTELYDVEVFKPECFTLQSTNPYTMGRLSAQATDIVADLTDGSSVEVQLCKLSIHSSDYYPLSVSDLKFGPTMYWNKHSSQKHTLVALDFSGIVMAVGKNVRKLKVGDEVVACYPSIASSKVVLPEDACYKTKKLPFLKGIPCVSFVVLAWEILTCVLVKARRKRTLGIFTTAPDSALMKVLELVAGESGWNVSVEVKLGGLVQNVQNSPVFVLIPPYDQSCLAQLSQLDTVEHVFIVCDKKESVCFPSSILQSDTSCIHFLELCNIFQKSNLRTQRAYIQKWLKMKNLDRACIPLHYRTFQATLPDTASDQSTNVGSYFRAKTLPLIVLSNGASMSDVSQFSIQYRPKKLFRDGCVYIVSGGLSGLGLETVRFISHWGGRCIATLSRSAPSEKVKLQINALEKRYDVKIVTLQCDVSVTEQVLNAVTVIGQTFPFCPIKGVFHSAAVLHDGLLETLDTSLFEKVLRPKVSGALNLHYATLNSNVDYFVCYSSISSFIGNASQANYAAANSFLDALCHYRRNLGLAGQSINWGPLKLGLLQNKEDFQKFLESKGLMTLKVPEIHEALKCCLLGNKTQHVVCKFHFRNLRNNVLSQNGSLKARLTALVEKELDGSAGPESRRDVQASFDSYIRGVLSDICHVDSDELAGESALAAVGIDSMLAMTMQNRIFQEMGLNVPLVTLLDPNSTLSSLVELLEQSSGRCEKDVHL